MNLDGLTIHSLKNYSEEVLKGGRIDKIYQLNSSAIYLAIRGYGNTLHCLISIGEAAPRIQFLPNAPARLSDAPMFTMVLRKHLENGRIGSIKQSSLDRVLILEVLVLGQGQEIVSKELIIELAGKNSNIILVVDGVIIESIKHIGIGVNRYRQILPNRRYILPPLEANLNIITDESSIDATFAEKYPSYNLEKFLLTITVGLGRPTVREIIWRAGLEKNIVVEKLDEKDFLSINNSLTEIKAEVLAATNFYVYLEESSKLNSVSSCKLFSLADCEEHIFDNINLAIEFALQKRIIEIPEKIIFAKLLSTEIAKQQKKITSLEEDLRIAENAEQYKIIADNLISYVYKIKKGQIFFECQNIYDGNPISIELDPLLTPSDNVQKYYKKYNKLKRSLEYLAEEIKKAKEMETYYNSIELSLQKIENSLELEEIKEELVQIGIIKTAKKNRKSALNITSEMKIIPLENGARILVGKNNKQNDYLTFKVARPQDLWFHVKNIAGSHVILQSAGNPTTEEIFQAAQTAVSFSKANSSTKVVVDYVERKFVKKPTGSKPGYVIYSSEKSLLV